MAVVHPVLPKAVVTLGGIPDLKAFAQTGPGACKESEMVPALVAGADHIQLVDPFVPQWARVAAIIAAQAK